jgi:hypothetical protein
MRPYIALALVMLAALAGCTYTAEVENLANEQISVRLIQADPVMSDWVLEDERIISGGKVTIGPQRVPWAQVVFEAGPRGQPELVYRTPIKPGLTKFRIDLEGEGDDKRVVVERIHEKEEAKTEEQGIAPVNETPQPEEDG